MATWRVPTSVGDDYEIGEYDIVSDDMIEPVIPEAYETITEIANDRYHYYFLSLQSAVSSGKIDINRKCSKVKSPAGGEVISYELIRVECARSEEGRNHFYMDVIVKAVIEFSQPNEDNSQKITERHRQWFRLRTCENVQLLDEKVQCTNDAAQHVTVMIYDRKDRLKGIHFTEYLSPVLASRDIDKEAERILRRNGMAYTVDSCAFVDAWELAEKLNLEVRFAKLSAAGTISGKLYLPGRAARVYEYYGATNPFSCAGNGQLPLEGIDLTSEITMDYLHQKAREAHFFRKTPVMIDTPTIMIDPLVCDTEAKQLTAIIHECVHYDVHSLFFYLQNHQKERLAAYAMTEEDYETYEQERESIGEISLIGDTEPPYDKREEIDWIEWQARQITICMRMPAKQTKCKIEELYRHYAHIEPFMSYETVTAHVISDLAYFYRVSKEMAKIRMIELGYEIARGVMNFVDGKYVPSFRTSTGGYDRNIVYAISTVEAARLYAEDQKFHDALLSGQYVFAENFFCLNRPEYVVQKSDGFHLTDYARIHVDECCMSFSIKRHGRSSFYDKASLHNDNIPNDAVAAALASIPLVALIESQENVETKCSELPATYGETLVYHRKRLGISQEELAWQLGIKRATLREYEQNMVFEPSRIFFASVGRVLKLPGYYTRDMMNKAHCPLLASADAMKHLEFVVNFMYMRSLEECYAVMTHFNLPPLLGRSDDETSQECRIHNGKITAKAETASMKAAFVS